MEGLNSGKHAALVRDGCVEGAQGISEMLTSGPERTAIGQYRAIIEHAHHEPVFPSIPWWNRGRPAYPAAGHAFHAWR